MPAIVMGSAMPQIQLLAAARAGSPCNMPGILLWYFSRFIKGLKCIWGLKPSVRGVYLQLFFFLHAMVEVRVLCKKSI